MLLKLIYTKKTHFLSVTCLYNGAGEYSVGKLPEQAWLSKGCKDIRNVIGYPGLIRPSAQTCLVLLTGFELERAAKLIKLIEPDKLALGNSFDSLNEKHIPLMEYFSGEFANWKNSYKSIMQTQFNFSCKDIDKTIFKLNEIITENKDDNIIIVPLNTKLSTIATAIVALQNKKVQLCYSVPEIYNVHNYSKPSDDIKMVQLDDINIPQLKY